jgi:hypothetical protein
MSKRFLSIYLVLVVLVAGLIPGCTGGGDTYALTMAENPAAGGTATDLTGGSPYEKDTEVSIQAIPASCYRFTGWTVAPVGAGTFDDATAPTTNFTMPGQDVTVTANFVLVYDLTISSTAGGAVTDPGEGTSSYDAGTVVDLVATPDDGYRFVKWTGDVGTIADIEDATTTIAMNNNYAIVANFALGTLIAGVPDTSQPPTMTLPTTINPTNYCAPMAVVNILGYWDVVMGHSNAQNLTGFQQPPNLNTVAEYLGYFMDTNNQGSPDRLNGADGHLGTYHKDLAPGTLEFVRWDAAHNPPGPTMPPFPLPGGKLGYDWTVTQDCTTDYDLSLNFYTGEINAGRPLVVSFSYWNPVDEEIAVTDPETAETVDVFSWGDQVPGSYDPVENWEPDIGHAVTGVGYVLNWDPDGSAGPLGKDDYVIVHDNWGPTPKNIAIPWANWVCLWQVDPA